MNGTSRIVATAAVAILAALSGCGKNGDNGNSASKTYRLNGAGSSFVNPIMTKWADLYNKEKGVEVNYQSTGSGNGVQQMTAKTVDFGCTDAPMNEKQLDAARRTAERCFTSRWSWAAWCRLTTFPR